MPHEDFHERAGQRLVERIGPLERKRACSFRGCADDRPCLADGIERRPAVGEIDQ